MNVATESIGSRIKRAREDRQLSIDEVNQRIHIHPDILTHIEADQFTNWPGGDVYAKSFLKQYCQFLELNAGEIISEYEQLGHASDKVDLSFDRYREHNKAKEKQIRVVHIFVKKHWKAAALALAVLAGSALIVWGAWSLTAGIADWVQGWRENRAEIEARRPKPQPKAKNQVEINQPQPTQAVVPTAIPVKPTEEAASVPPKGYLNHVSVGTFPKILADDPIILQVKAVNDAWMRATVDGSVVFESILKKGDSEKWIGSLSLTLKMGRPEAVSLKVNGYEIGAPGNGQARHVRIDHEGMEKI